MWIMNGDVAASSICSRADKVDLSKDLVILIPMLKPDNVSWSHCILYKQYHQAPSTKEWTPCQNSMQHCGLIYVACFILVFLISFPSSTSPFIICVIMLFIARNLNYIFHHNLHSMCAWFSHHHISQFVQVYICTCKC